jgi:quinol monooxygenase YgiN
MDGRGAWQVELVVTPGARDALRVLTDEMVEATREEPGVLRYERCISAGGTVIHVYER